MGQWDRTRRRLVRLAMTEVGEGKLAVTLLLSLLAFSVLLALGFRSSTAFVDKLDRTHEQQLVVNFLDRQAEAGAGQIKVQVTWDEAFDKIGSGQLDPAWADTYIGDFLWSNFGYDRLYVVSPRGDMLRAWRDGRAEPAAAGGADFAQLGAQVQRQLAAMGSNRAVFGQTAKLRQLQDTAWPFSAQGKPLTRWGHALIQINGQPAMLSVVPVLPDARFDRLRASPNHLVAVQFFDPAFLGGMGRQLLLKDMQQARAAPVNDELNSLPLISQDGVQVGQLTWHAELRSAMVRGKTRPFFAAYLLFLVAIMLGGLSVIKMLRNAMARLRQREAQATHAARHDEMTGLPNRMHFIERLEAQLSVLSVKQDRGLAVAFLDLDHFKYINDTLGHPAGDALVRQVAARARKCLPASDLIARLGGDEFVVMRTAPRDHGGIRQLGADLMALFAAPFNIDGRVIDVTASCGISWAPDQGLTGEDLLRNADIALFRAKQRGRARWRAFDREMEGTVRRRLLLELELRKALQGNGLSLAYQPIVDAETGAVAGAEALLRWNHQELGALSPALFVPVAEQAGMMPLLGWWVVGRVFEQCREWPGVNISINLSPLQLTARGFLEDLAVLTQEFAVDPARITFEVTEGVLMERGTGAFAVLEGLKQLGFAVALDDFGTGYSSLSYLRGFDFDRIKIDRSFVHDIESDCNAHSILKAIVALGHSLNTRTVAEGVETPLQRDLVRAAGCELIQGYLFHRPMPAEDFSLLLKGRRQSDTVLRHRSAAA